MSAVGQATNSNREEPKGVAPVDGADAAAAATGSAASASPQGPQQAADGKVTPITEKVRREAAALRNTLAFTQMVGVLMRSPHYKQCTLADLEWLVIPPLLAGQFRIGEAKPKEGLSLPVAVVLWARVSAEVDKRLMETDSPSFQLKPEEWTSGDILWLVHAAGETRFVRHVVEQLTKTTFKGREVKALGRGQDGKPKVHLLSDNPPAQSAQSAQPA
jgi:hemolysin-activating ACP:hemolysin acyltransferase